MDPGEQGRKAAILFGFGVVEGFLWEVTQTLDVGK